VRSLLKPLRLTLCAAFLLGPAPLRPELDGKIRSQKQDLEKLRRELSRKESEKERAAKAARELAREVERISRELESSRRSLKRVEAELNDVESRRKSMEDRLWASRAGLGRWEDGLARELRIFYKRRMAAGASAFTELARRRALLQDQAHRLDFARRHHASVEEVHGELAAAEAELEDLRFERKREQSRVAAAQTDMRSLHKTAQGRQAVLERELQDLRASARRMEELVQSLIRKREAERAKAETVLRAPSAAGKWRGRLPWPAEGQVVERYGRSKHPALDTYVFSNGVKLKPAAGAAVRAVEAGEVVYAETFMSYGLTAIVQHRDDMHTIYAHLGRLDVKRGQKVSVGQALGAAGQDDAGRPVIYFELRVDGSHVDPLAWLK
jgi:murein hydrolase activator